jgi:hypothetical protein
MGSEGYLEGPLRARCQSRNDGFLRANQIFALTLAGGAKCVSAKNSSGVPATIPSLLLPPNNSGGGSGGGGGGGSGGGGGGGGGSGSGSGSGGGGGGGGDDGGGCGSGAGAGAGSGGGSGSGSGVIFLKN